MPECDGSRTCVNSITQAVPTANHLYIPSWYTGYAFLTELNIFLQYTIFELENKSKSMTTTVTLIGMHLYNVMPMTSRCSTDYMQETMRTSSANKVMVYIDNIGALSDN